MAVVTRHGVGNGKRRSRGRRVDYDAPPTPKPARAVPPPESPLGASAAALYLAFPTRLMLAASNALTSFGRAHWRRYDRQLRNELVRELGPHGNPAERPLLYGSTLWLYTALFFYGPLALAVVAILALGVPFRDESPAWVTVLLVCTFCFGLAPSVCSGVLLTARFYPLARDEVRWRKAGEPEQWVSDQAVTPKNRDLAAGVVLASLVALPVPIGMLVFG